MTSWASCVELQASCVMNQLLWGANEALKRKKRKFSSTLWPLVDGQLLNLFVCFDFVAGHYLSCYSLVYLFHIIHVLLPFYILRILPFYYYKSEYLLIDFTYLLITGQMNLLLIPVKIILWIISPLLDHSAQNIFIQIYLHLLRRKLEVDSGGI